ncbi:MAG: protein phosphatase 2C domain-containing protein [Ruminococcus sp.]|nr:protein phosphatase 2C domain-containing protein [Ruminococcus sp.]
MYRAFNYTTTGASHILSRKVCQDASASLETDKYKLIVVSDGHGSSDCFRSDRGSKFAVEAFCKCAEEAFKCPEESEEDDDINADEESDTDKDTDSDPSYDDDFPRNFAEILGVCKTQKQIDDQLRRFMGSIVTKWNARVDEDIAEYPFTDDELADVSDIAKKSFEYKVNLRTVYGATLIGIILTDDFWFGIHIGDGKCVTFNQNGEDHEPIPWDDQCFMNVTTSICDPYAISDFRSYFSRELPTAVFIGSDGIDGSFANQKYHHDFYRIIISSFAEADIESAVDELESYLPELSAHGSGDDVSVACILDIDHIRENPELYEIRKAPFIKIIRVGNLGAADLSDDYLQKNEIEAYAGTVRLDMVGCRGFNKGIMKFDILDVQDDLITISFNGNECEISPTERAEIVTKDLVDGIAQFDTILLQYIKK